MVALTMAFSVTLRPSISSANEVFLLMGPERRPPQSCERNGARLGENGLRELSAESEMP